MKAIHKQRLLTLAEHLEKGKLGHKKFHFGYFNETESRVADYFEESPKKRDAFDAKGCGTLGCAIGECPIVFPTHWKFETEEGSFDPILRRGGDDAWDELSSATKFFGLHEDGREAQALFVPGERRPWANDKTLSAKATRKQVANSIRKFVAWKEAGNQLYF